MCGIYGAVSRTRRPLGRPEALEGMGEALRHRGPDGQGLLLRPHVGLGTDRLRVIDLHERADQPFASPEGRLWLACNGEIYNAGEIRRRYPDYPYRSRSDVETILPLFAARGACGLSELDGMFGLAVWDEAAGRLTLARDRAGEKPLFYTRIGEEVWFASELQALLAHPEVSRELDPVALSEFLALGYVLEPRTPFATVRRVEAGTILAFDREGETVTRYWDPAELAAGPVPEGAAGDPEAAVAELSRRLEAAVTKQVTSDVPVGVFTSGGLDSSLLAVLAARVLGPDRVHTFAARFAAPSYDESPWAAHAAARFGTRHVEVAADEPALAEALAAVSTRLGEPLADPAVLPTYLLARAARERVTVILSGEGADELFGGYPTYLGHKVAPWVLKLPRPVRRGLTRALGLVPPSSRKVTLEFLLRRFLAEAEKPWAERHLSWFGTGLAEQPGEGRETWRAELLGAWRDRPSLAGAMLLDYQTYLRDDLLVKVDRATMLSSVEARAPFLDRDLTAFALALPSALKVRRLTSKWVLKRAARAWLPAEVVERRKRGLSVPVASWINDGLRAETDRLLDPERLARQGIVDPRAVEGLLAEHRAGRANHARPLWALVVLGYWLERWVPGMA